MERIEHKVEQNSIEWFEARLGLPTSSQISRLLTKSRSKGGGLSKTAITYAEAKAAELFWNEDVSDFSGNYATEWGHQYEPVAMELFNELEPQYELKKGCFWTYNGSGSSPDGQTEDKRVIGEIKCPMSKVVFARFRCMKKQEDLLAIDKSYYLQVQHQLYCTGAEFAIFIVFHPLLYFSEMNERSHLGIKYIKVIPDIDVFKELDEKIPIFNDYVHSELKKMIG